MKVGAPNDNSLSGDALWALVAKLADEPGERAMREVLAEAPRVLGAACTFLSGDPTPVESAGSELRIVVPGTSRYLIVRWQEAPTPSDVERARCLASCLSLALRVSDVERSAETSAFHVTLGRAVGGVIHDIGNPLAALLSSLDAVRAGFEVEEALDDAFAAAALIRAATERLRRFTGSPAAARSRIDVGEAIRAAVRVASFETRGRAEVVVHVTPGLVVQARSGEVEHVLVNLLINAVHALVGGGGLQHRITVSAFPRTGDVILEVHDTGPGIAPEHLDKIFEEGFTTKPPSHASGLGLAICREIVTQLGGAITVDAAAGQGTRVSLRLPDGGSEEAARPVTEGRPSAALPAVLVVDRDPLVARGLKRALGHSAVVTLATSSEDAAALIQETRFRLVLCEHAPPLVDALALRRSHAERWPELARQFVLVLVDAHSELPPGARVAIKPIAAATLEAILADDRDAMAVG